MSVASPLRVAFAGTPPFAVPPLLALLSSRHRVVGVMTQPDRPQGRGRHPAPSAVKQAALAHGLGVLQPDTLRTPEAVQAVAALAPDVMVVVAFGQILPAAILCLPRLGCLNIHGSLLPRWRGAAPIQRAILAGDRHTGITIMQMDEGLDTGAILATDSVPIGERDTSATLHDVLAARGGRALLEVLDALAGEGLAARAQPAAGVTYANKITKAESRIDWQHAAAAISRQVRAFNPWPVAQTVFAGEPLRIHDAWAPERDAATDPKVQPGTWLGLADEALRVACGSGALHVTQLQRAGRRVVAAADFMNSAGAPTGRFG